MTTKKKVLIIDPSVIITEGLMKILKENSQFEVLSPLYDIEGLKGRLITKSPDIMIINPTLVPPSKQQDFINTTQDCPDMVIIALVYQYVEQNSLRLYHGIIDICEDREPIFKIVSDCIAQYKPIEQQPDENNYELTKRELDVLVKIAKGLMNKEIADKLNISIHTVISHRKNITRKTNIKSVAGLTMYALMNNLIEE